jgi:hypothetical protein
MLYILVAASAVSNATAQKIPEQVRLALTNDQKQIVSALSGASKIGSHGNLKRRWTSKEKKQAREYLAARLLEVGVVPEEQSYKVDLPHKNRSSNPFRGTNLFAIMPSSIPSAEYVVIGAHYDSVSESPGAMDNATGCALVYGVSKLVSTLTDRKRNLVVAFFDEEETGHAGSYAFANFIKERGFVVHSVHTADMVGWDNDGDRNIELELPSPDLESIYRRHASSLGVLAYTTETSLTDHREFRNAGYNAIGIAGEHVNGDSSPHHHLSTDTVDTVDFDYLAFVTFLVYGVVEELVTR